MRATPYRVSAREPDHEGFDEAYGLAAMPAIGGWPQCSHNEALDTYFEGFMFVGLFFLVRVD